RGQLVALVQGAFGDLLGDAGGDPLGQRLAMQRKGHGKFRCCCTGLEETVCRNCTFLMGTGEAIVTVNPAYPASPTKRRPPNNNDVTEVTSELQFPASRFS